MELQHLYQAEMGFYGGVLDSEISQTTLDRMW